MTLVYRRLPIVYSGNSDGSVPPFYPSCLNRLMKADVSNDQSARHPGDPGADMSRRGFNAGRLVSPKLLAQVGVAPARVMSPYAQERAAKGRKEQIFHPKGCRSLSSTARSNRLCRLSLGFESWYLKLPGNSRLLPATPAYFSLIKFEKYIMAFPSTNPESFWDPLHGRN